MISKREAWENVIEKEGKWWSQGSEEARRTRIKNSDLVVPTVHPILFFFFKFYLFVYLLLIAPGLAHSARAFSS